MKRLFATGFHVICVGHISWHIDISTTFVMSRCEGLRKIIDCVCVFISGTRVEIDLEEWKWFHGMSNILESNEVNISRFKTQLLICFVGVVKQVNICTCGSMRTLKG